MIRLSLDRHRHLLGPRKDVFASPYGLLGGGWAPNEEVTEWMVQTGFHATVIEVQSDAKDNYLSFENLSRSIPVMTFENEDDALMFKMKWL